MLHAAHGPWGRFRRYSPARQKAKRQQAPPPLLPQPLQSGPVHGHQPLPVPCGAVAGRGREAWRPQWERKGGGGGGHNVWNPQKAVAAQVGGAGNPSMHAGWLLY